MSEFAALQAVRLKGRADAEVIATSTGAAVPPELLDRLVADGLLKGGPAYRITAEGRERLAELVAAERATVEQAELEAAYEAFHAANDLLKEVVTAWQMIAPDTPNDHSDSGYDATVVGRLLEDVDPALRPVLSRFVAAAPRLACYPPRFDHAVAKLREGDTSWLAKPISDSYHTVWFEL
ncbi:MAG: hypothetical protein ABR549_17580, partial [Mycobacteriales bacterium]